MEPNVTQYWGAEPHRKQKSRIPPFFPILLAAKSEACVGKLHGKFFLSTSEGTRRALQSGSLRHRGFVSGIFFCIFCILYLCWEIRDKRDHMRRVNDYDFHFLGVWGIFKPFLSIPQTTCWKIAVRTFRSKRLADKVGGDRKTTKLPEFPLVLWCKTSFPKSRSLELFWVVG